MFPGQCASRGETPSFDSTSHVTVADRQRSPPIQVGTYQRTCERPTQLQESTSPRCNKQHSGCRRPVLPCMLPLRQPSLLLQLGWPQVLLVIEHYRGENRQKFDVEKQTNKLGYKSCGFEQKVHKTAHAIGISENQADLPTRDVTRTHPVTHERTSEEITKRARTHARTNVRTEHQAHCAHPAVGITSTEPGGKAPQNESKLKRFVNDLERTTDFLCLWYALIVAQSRIAPAAAIVRIIARCAR